MDAKAAADGDLSCKITDVVMGISCAYEEEIERMRILHEERLQTLHLRLYLAENALEIQRAKCSEP